MTMTNRLVLLCGFIGSISATSIAGRYTSFGDYGYFEFKEGYMSWQQARHACLDDGALLWTMRNVEEADYVINALWNAGMLGFYTFWIGFSDIYTEGLWMGEDGNPLGDEQLWLDGQPNGGLDENCAMYWNNQGIHDYPCYTNGSAICRLEPSSYWKTYTVVEGLGRYKVHPKPASWTEAEVICRAEGATIAFLDSDEEAQAIQTMLGDVDAVFIGRTGSYAKSASDDDCLVFTAQRMYKDAECGVARAFLCEHSL